MRILVRNLLAIILITAALPAVAQSKRDSLWTAWQNPALQDTQRLQAIQSLTWPMLNINLDSALLLANMQLEFARKVSSAKWEAKALYNLGTANYYKGNLAESFAFYEKSLAIRKTIGDKIGEAAVYGNFGLIYGQQGNSVKDLEYQLKALALYNEIHDTLGITTSYNNLGNIYKEQGDSTQALNYYNEAIRIYKFQGKEDGVALIYNNIGTLYKDYGMFDKSLDYLYRSLDVRKSLGDHLGMGINYVNLGTIYGAMKNYPKAREATLQSIEQFKALGDQASLSNSYFTLGKIYVNEGKYQEAIKWCSQALDNSEAADKVAVQHASCFCLYKAYKEMGNTSEALKYYEHYEFLDDSLSKKDLQVELDRIEFEKKMLNDSLRQAAEKTTLLATHQKELHRKNTLTKIILITGIAILMMALLFLTRMLRFERSSEALKLKTRELERQKLVNEISLLKTQVNPHFLFNSLSILSSLVRVDPELSEKFIDQLSRSYRYILEQKDQSLVTLRTELGFIDSYSFLLQIRFENKFRLHITLPELILDKYYIAPLTLQLLVENAVKHNRMSLQEPLVVDITTDDQEMLIVKNKLQPRSTPVSSTGVGLQNIINRYALLTDRPVWAGETEEQFVVRIPLLTNTGPEVPSLSNPAEL